MFFSRISFKLAVMIGLSLAGMVIMAPIALYTMRAQMMTDRQAKTQQMIDVGYGILNHYQKLEADGGEEEHVNSHRDIEHSSPCARFSVQPGAQVKLLPGTYGGIRPVW